MRGRLWTGDGGDGFFAALRMTCEGYVAHAVRRYRGRAVGDAGPYGDGGTAARDGGDVGRPMTAPTGGGTQSLPLEGKVVSGVSRKPDDG